MVLGNAYAQSGDMETALADMSRGLSIIDKALGRRNPTYFAAQMAYSHVLDRAGWHAQAAQWKAAAEQTEKDLYGGQCVGCTINVAAFQ